MFTGIITDVGEVSSIEETGGGMRAAIRCHYAAETIDLGASIACAGICLTATSIEVTATGSCFTVDVSKETLSKTTLGSWRTGSRVNLERSLKLGDELGGHLVSGHVDGVAKIVERQDEADMRVYRFAPPHDLLPLIAHKGSVALDGTSLTVNEADETFTVAMIPHTLSATTWSERKAGDTVNIEVDTIARYVARLAAMQPMAR
ncbi:MAG: riboflavin synthase [Pseudomonadota bacterium]